MPDKKPVTLHAHNQTRLGYVNPARAPRLNNISCPTCGDPLFDTRPGEIIKTTPPRVRTHCGHCKYKGVRLL
jgi:hypothetical protein